MNSDVLVGIQDMGAAGLTSSSVEMAARAGNGIELDLDACRAARPSMTRVRDHALRVAGAHARCRQSGPRSRGARHLREVGSRRRGHRARHRHRQRSSSRRAGACRREFRSRRSPKGCATSARSRARRRSTTSARSTSRRSRRPADLGAALLKLLARRTSRPRSGSTASTITWCALGTVVRPGADAAVDAHPRRRRRIRRTPRASRSRPTATRASVALDPVRGRAPRRRRGLPQRLDASAPSRSPSPTASTSAIPSGPRSCGSSSKRCAASATPAARSARPSSRATSSLYNETEGQRDQADADDRHGRAHRQRRRRRRPRVPAPDCAIALLGVNTDEIGGSEYLDVIHGKIAGHAAAARPRARARRRSRVPRAGRARTSFARRTTAPKAASPSRSPSRASSRRARARRSSAPPSSSMTRCAPTSCCSAKRPRAS